jgi:Ribbon-helix-helix protein, copG family
MYTQYIVKRTQIYLEERQDGAIAKRAAAEGVTKSTVIRRAIDAYLTGPDEKERKLSEFRAAAKEAFGSAPYLPPGKQYVEELRRIDAERQAELERRWRS